MPIITRKIELKLHHFTEREDCEELKNCQWEFWRIINNNLYKVANRISSHLFFNNDEIKYRIRVNSPQHKELEKLEKKKDKWSEEEKIKYENLLSEENKYVKDLSFSLTAQNITYRIASHEFLSVIPSDVLTCLNQNIVRTYKENELSLLRGERTLSTFKRGMPIPFSIKDKLRKRTDGTIYLSWFKDIEWDLFFGRDASNNREIVERILSGEYSASNSSLQEKKGKIFLLLVVQLPEKQNELNPKKIVGVDLGINIPLYAALNDNEYGGVAIGSREAFLEVRARLSAQRRELQKSLRMSTNGGRGRLHKLQALERLNEKERNWVHLQNHIYSREIIRYALSNQAGVIQMENLSGFGRDAMGNAEDEYKYLLRNWSYFELQNMIETKAKAEKIAVRYVNPYHTSQRCSFCGSEEKGQRVNQSTFICKNLDCEKGKGHLKNGEFQGINADWNAARNIALSKDFQEKKKNKKK